MTATLGEHDIQTAEGVEKSCRISKLIAHPEYNEQTKNDIMLGKLKCNVWTLYFFFIFQENFFKFVVPAIEGQ